MMGGDELTEGSVYSTAGFDDDFHCESEIDDCRDIVDGCDVVGPMTLQSCPTDFIAVNTSRQR